MQGKPIPKAFEPMSTQGEPLAARPVTKLFVRSFIFLILPQRFADTTT
jgi:hypothetical protein